jgi:hypothetical protein
MLVEFSTISIRPARTACKVKEIASGVKKNGEQVALLLHCANLSFSAKYGERKKNIGKREA